MSYIIEQISTLTYWCGFVSGMFIVVVFSILFAFFADSAIYKANTKFFSELYKRRAKKYENNYKK